MDWEVKMALTQANLKCPCGATSQEFREVFFEEGDPNCHCSDSLMTLSGVVSSHQRDALGFHGNYVGLCQKQGHAIEVMAIFLAFFLGGGCQGLPVGDFLLYWEI